MSSGYPFLDEMNRLRGVAATQAAEIERLREALRQAEDSDRESVAMYQRARDRATAAEAERDRLRALLEAVVAIAERNERGAVTEAARAALASEEGENP